MIAVFSTHTWKSCSVRAVKCDEFQIMIMGGKEELISAECRKLYTSMS